MSMSEAEAAPSAGIIRYAGRALRLVWSTNPVLTIGFGTLTLVAGLLPAGIAWVGQLIIDAVVAAIAGEASYHPALNWIIVELPGGVYLI